jgi:hypothetical protein
MLMSACCCKDVIARESYFISLLTKLMQVYVQFGCNSRLCLVLNRIGTLNIANVTDA